MRCYLVSPDYPGKHRLLAPVPPLGIALIAAVLEREGVEVRVEDQFASGLGNDALAGKILAFAPDLIGIGSLTPSINHALALATALRGRGFAGKIIMGSVHPTLFAEKILGHGAVDIVVRGEGEKTAQELIQALQKGAPLEGVPGLSFRDGGGKIIHNPGREQLRNLDELPLPAWHLFDLQPYMSAPMLQVYGLALPIQATRGCSERCTFCGQEIFTRRLRYRSVDSVLREIDELVDRHHVEYFIFADANFPPSKRYGLEFCARYQKTRHHGKVSWCCETKVNMVDQELLGAMREAGCTLIEYGFEAGDQRILDSIGKHTTLADGLRAARLTRAAGMHTLGLFMIGLPGETAREIYKTFRYAQRLDCDMAKFNIAIPLPGSELFKQHEKELLANFRPETFSSWHRPGKDGPPITVVPGGLSAHQLIRLQTLGMLMFYLRPKVILRHLRRRTLKLGDMINGGRFLLGEFLASLNPLRREIRPEIRVRH